MHYNCIDLPASAARKAAPRTPEGGVLNRFSASSGEPAVTGIRSYSRKALLLDLLLLPAGL